MATEYKMNYTGSEVNAKLGLMPSLGITGAEVGQTVKIIAVDDNGRPTAWEPVTLGDKWELLGTLDFSESSNGDDMVLTWDDPVRKIYITGSSVDSAAYVYGDDASVYRDLLLYQPGAAYSDWKSTNFRWNACSHNWGWQWRLYCETNDVFATGWMFQSLTQYSTNNFCHFPGRIPSGYHYINGCISGVKIETTLADGIENTASGTLKVYGVKA